MRMLPRTWKYPLSAGVLTVPLSVGVLSMMVGLGLNSCSSDDSGDSPGTTASGGGGSESVGGSAAESETTGGGEAGSGGSAAESETTGGGEVGSGGTGATGDGDATNRGEPETSAGGAADGDESVATTGRAGAGGEGGAAGEGNVISGPTLTDLLVEGGRVEQQPAFDPEALRYSVLAAEDPNPLVVTATAEGDLTITIAEVAAESGEPVTLTDVEPGSEFEVRVSDADGASRSYTVLYLPYDFFEFRVTAHESGASRAPIYMSPYYTSNGASYYLAKLDNNGVPLFYRRLDSPGSDFKKHWNGVMSYHNDNQQILLDSDYQNIGAITSVGYEQTNKHDFRILPNGNYAVMVYNTVVRDLSAQGGPVDGEVRDSILQEISPAGDLIFEWNSWDYLSDEAGSDSHLNAIEFDDDGNWILSLRAPSQVIKLDRATGDVIWRLGGESSDFEFVNDPLEGFCGQHSVSLLDNGNILMFDNGALCYINGVHSNHTRVAEYALDEEEMTADLVWSYDRPPKYSSTMGSAQRLPNGNTLVGWGSNPGPLMVTEVDRDGNVVFDLEGYGPVDQSTLSYRAMRFEE